MPKSFFTNLSANEFTGIISDLSERRRPLPIFVKALANGAYGCGHVYGRAKFRSFENDRALEQLGRRVRAGKRDGTRSDLGRNCGEIGSLDPFANCPRR